MRRLTQHDRDDHGVGTIFVVLAMLPILVGVAFAIDVGRYVVEARSAQNSADATVLAVATDCALDEHRRSTDYSPYRKADQSISRRPDQPRSATARSRSRSRGRSATASS